ncbi:LysR substrate-binding domain-containing protein [Streptosporangium lutulentum]
MGPRTGVVLHPVVTEPVFALLPADHPLAVLDEVSLHRLAEEDWAVPEPNDDRTREYWSSALALTGVQARTPYEAEGRLLIDIVRAGRAVSLCQATFDEMPGIAVRPIAGNPLWYRHILTWHHKSPVAPFGDAIAQRVTDQYTANCAPAPSTRDGANGTTAPRSPSETARRQGRRPHRAACGIGYGGPSVTGRTASP